MANDILSSWLLKEGIHSIDYLLEWVKNQNDTVEMKVEKIPLEQSDFWLYEKGLIKNKSNSFFSISGIQHYKKGQLLSEQPIMIQPEIGFLGIICKKINGVLHFLMQAKIEPGNINKVQISPTIQATKSNFSQKHGGSRPAFLDYFLHAKQNEIIVDQIQSEQASRFLKKRNRNVILHIEDAIEETSSHRWMTLGQIKQLMRIDNLINMNTRTVLSCIPFANMKFEEEVLESVKKQRREPFLLSSLINTVDHRTISEIFSFFNEYKMFTEEKKELIDLYRLKNWSMQNGEFVCHHPFPFKISFFNISIEGREVRNWSQPLVAVEESATFGLLCWDDQGVKKFLTKAKPEIGCFDGIELGPTIQHEANGNNQIDEIPTIFYKKLVAQKGIITDVLLSEEGGRFYHEQNRNVIILLDTNEVPTTLPPGYFWTDFKTLNALVQFNNLLNIQLRNLLSLLEV